MTFEEEAGKTLLVMHELYPTKQALDAAMTSGENDGMDETLDQLDECSSAGCESATGVMQHWS